MKSCAVLHSLLRDRRLMVLATTVVLVMSSMSAIPIVLREISVALSVSEHSAALVIPSYMAGYFLGSVLYTLFSSRIGSTVLTRYLLMLFVVSNLFAATASSVLVLTVARFVSGIASSSFVPFTLYYLSKNHGKSGSAVGTVFALSTAGGLIGSLVAGLVPWRAAFLIPALLGAALVALGWKGRDASEGALARPDRRFTLSLFRHGEVCMLLLYIFALRTISVMVYTWMGTHLQVENGWTKAMVSLFYLTAALLAVVGSMAGGLLLDRIRGRGALIVFGSLFMVFFAGFCWERHAGLVPLLMLGALFGSARQGMHVSFIGLLSRADDTIRAAALGMNSVVVFLANTLGSAGIIRATRMISFEQVMLGIGCLFVVCYATLLSRRNLIYRIERGTHMTNA